ncbi:SPOR domain-containing protein [Undibacterium fentianense]|uniref:SPOR domain-containing protein n=1 Tax=Undibacterium fentianense TaxID=2828728 RepID=A0A941E0D1_9BURK|nr:SPOR domain-containing protein [Undibacterium fentianense]MBR7798702.1 SPOR domain-containing protein [Undibacterium fentianense]
MSLDSLFKQNNKNKNSSEASDESVSGEFRSRAEEDSIAASESATRSKPSRSTKRQANNARKQTDDTALPEKKRARRRLIGAVTLVLGAVIGLPMVFDSEPKPSNQQIAIEFPSKEGSSSGIQRGPTANSAPLGTMNSGMTQGIDKAEELLDAPPVTVPKSTEVHDQLNEEIKSPAPASTSKLDTRTIAKVETKTNNSTSSDTAIVQKSDATVPAKNPGTNSLPVTNKLSSDPIKKMDAKHDQKADVKRDNADDAARALALLEGRSFPEKDVKSNAKNTKSETADGHFLIQVAALNSPVKVRELQTKMKSANIASYTQKIVTKNGEVIRVRVGPFNTKSEAEKMRAKLAKLGLNGSLLPN